MAEVGAQTPACASKPDPAAHSRSISLALYLTDDQVWVRKGLLCERNVGSPPLDLALAAAEVD
ncbi:MAG: hypothetical protein ACI8XD_001357 [Thermoproteota archaeon]|jgi:hypothetical protein